MILFHLRLLTEADELDEEELPSNEQPLDGAVQSVAEAYPAPESDEGERNENEDEPTDVASRPANDVPEESPVPEAPPKIATSGNKKTPVQRDEEDEDVDEEEPAAPVRSSKRGPQGGATYFPVTFGSTNGGAIAIANSYSTGKGKQLKIIFPINSIRLKKLSTHEEVQRRAELPHTDRQQSPSDEAHNNAAKIRLHEFGKRRKLHDSQSRLSNDYSWAKLLVKQCCAMERVQTSNVTK